MNILAKQARRTVTGSSKPTVRDTQEMTTPGITLTDRLRSGYHRIWYEATQALRWSRGIYRETPIGTILNLTPVQHDRIEELGAIYGTRFELRYPPETTLLNYGYLDMLDLMKFKKETRKLRAAFFEFGCFYREEKHLHKKVNWFAITDFIFHLPQKGSKS